MEKLESKRFTKINRGLPPHIVQVIFSKLHISNLPNCRIISKTWNDLVLAYASSCRSLPQLLLLSTFDILNSPLVYRHYNPKIRCFDIDTMNSVASFGFEADCEVISILNACNGLLLIWKFKVDTDLDGILNPMTNEFIEVPQSQFDIERCIYSHGFGFSPKTKQYKLFKISRRPYLAHCCSLMEIFTFDRSGTNSNHNQWRRHFDSLPFEIFSNAAYLNGVIYWTGKENGKENEINIYGLDVETEKIESIGSLEVGSCFSKKGFIDILNDRIYVTIFFTETISSPSSKMRVWTMLQKNSWNVEFSIDDAPNGWNLSFRLIRFFEDGQILFQVCEELYCLDASGRKTKLKSLDTYEKISIRFCSINSLNFGSLKYFGWKRLKLFLFALKMRRLCFVFYFGLSMASPRHSRLA